MANFLDKLGEMAKTAADKTGDMIEIGKLNAKISAEQTTIAGLKQKIGSYYYEHVGAETACPPEMTELCEQIKHSEETIACLQTEITALKGENPPAEAIGKCSACGGFNAPGTKFCGACGAKL